MKKRTTKRGFTLIELLVVIAIISLLAGLLFPAVSSALNTAKKARARAACQSIETAIVTYSNEYNGRLPIPSPYGPSDNVITEVSNAGNSGNELYSKQILMVLMNIGANANANHVLNPKGIVFLETDVPSDDGTYKDPWGSQYQIILDRNLDGKINYLTNPSAQHRKKAVVVSAGNDRLFGDNSDNSESDDNIANVELPLID